MSLPRPSDLRADGAVLLISTYELGHQPLHLASPLGFLRAAGFSPRALDLSVERLDEAAVRTARLVAIAVPMHTALRLGQRVAERVRALNPGARLGFYGLYAPLHREHLEALGADFVIGGEHERELVGYVERLDRGDAAARPRLVVLDKLAFAAPSREGLPPLKRYAHLLSPSGERLAGYVEATRGCLHLCRHCPIPAVYEGRFFAVQAEVVLEDIGRQVAAGARHITFGDADFLNGPGHVLKIVRAMHAEHPELTFDATIKIEHILKHRELFPELGALGCAFVVSAVESLSDRVLAILDKGHTRQDVDAALAVTRAAGITLRPSLVPFSPWSTLEDWRALFDWIDRDDLADAIDPIHLAIRLLVPPGSLLAEHPEFLPHRGPLAADRLTYTWTHPDPRMDALQAAALAVVEAGASAGEDPRATLARLRALAHGHAPPPVEKPVARLPVRAPRLSEAWFC